MNKWIGMGRITKDIELQTTKTGTEYCKFTVAIDREKDKNGDKKTDFVDCTAFGKTGAFVEKYFAKGDGIEIIGRMESDKYTDKNGQNRTTWGLSVEQAFFPLGKGKKDSGSTVPSEAASGDGDLPF